MGSGKGGSKIQVSRYSYAIHYGICHGPVDHIAQIIVGSKTAWAGQLDDSGVIMVNNQSLFGGQKKEGGVYGHATFLAGGEEQTMPEYIADLYGRNRKDMPGYRGIASIFFHGRVMGSDGKAYGTVLQNATGYVSIGDVEDGDTLSVGGVTYTFRDAASVEHDVQIAIAADTTAANLAAAINGTDYWSSPHPTVYATVTDADVSLIARQAGFAGDGIALSSSDGDRLPVSGTALSGASDGSKSVWWHQWISKTYSWYQSRRGFIWVFNNPYLKTVWIKVARSAKGLDTRYEKIWRTDTEFDANPAHILFETATNRVWGSGMHTSQIDVGSYERAAKLFYDEGFGLSFAWSKESSVEEFQQEVLDHVLAMQFEHPRTGLLTIKPIRDDYDVDTMRVFDVSNSKVTNFSRKSWGETVNQIVVKYTNPDNESSASVSADDLANQIQQGATVAETREYIGIRKASLARMVAERDLASASQPLATCELEVDRSAWDLVPGDRCIVVSPQDNITRIVMLVGPIKSGQGKRSSAIQVSLTEDVFALGNTQYTIPDDTPTTPTVAVPVPVYDSMVFTLPYYSVQQEAASLTSASATPVYPSVYAGVLAARANAASLDFDLRGQVVNAAGITEDADLGTLTFTWYGELAEALDAETYTVIPGFLNTKNGAGIVSGGLLVIGDGDETECELALVTYIDETGYKLNRGVLDTVPRAWPVGTRCWFIGPDNTYADSTERSAFEDVTYRLLTNVEAGQLPAAQATPVTHTLSDRPWLPSRPANVFVEGQQFVDTVDATSASTVHVTWANRNRLGEDALILAWWESTVTPEVGQTTAIVITDLAGTTISEITDLAGTEYDIPLSAFGGAAEAVIHVYAERDGLRSFQAYSQHVLLPTGAGYGLGYGAAYGV